MLQQTCLSQFHESLPRAILSQPDVPLLRRLTADLYVEVVVRPNVDEGVVIGT